LIAMFFGMRPSLMNDVLRSTDTPYTMVGLGGLTALRTSGQTDDCV